MARKKQHLRYQAKKGWMHTVASADEGSTPAVASQVDTAKRDSSDKKTITKEQKQEFTKLPESETQFVRREIIYIGFIALVLLVFYLVIFLVFRFTAVDEWLSGLIQLKN